MFQQPITAATPVAALTVAALLCCSLATVLAGPAVAQETDFKLLWPNGAPGATGTAAPDQPGLWVYPATENPTGTAVIICPGGGYGIHAVDHEGVQPARFFNRMGITAFVLRYRLAPYRHPIPLNDALRAIRFVRASAAEFKVDPNRIGIMGFSAGGHLASTALTLFNSSSPDANDPIDQLSSRPSFGILGYPVISFSADFAHRGSARNLLGPDASPEQLAALSNDRNVTKETPPTFLFHTAEDTGVPPENSLAFFAACRRNGVPAEIHVFQQGQHGVGLAPEHPALESWIAAAGTWLRQNALLAPGTRRAVSGTVQLNGQPLRWGSVALKPRSPHQPTAWAMVSNGKFNIPQSAGPLPGEYDVTVTHMGSVQPQPTVSDARILATPKSAVVADSELSLELSYTE